jgi:hypothetical protein
MLDPRPPELIDTLWCRTTIDQFILNGLKKKGLKPASQANRATLLRRITFDLTGLPPSPGELAEFGSDERPDAYERVVDRLLESPAYGERWGQHWLDLARFAETDGFEHDKVRPTAWQYRDWVVEALNEDLPYDRFLSLQIAGDELEPGDERARQATAFCLSGPDMPDVNSQDERRHVLLNEITSTVGAVFLGLQIGCAQCHDHKYDPISQADFYRLRACFDPAVSVQKDKSVSILKVDRQQAEPSYLYVRGDWRTRGPEVAPAFPRIANPWNEAVSGDPGTGEGRRAALSRWLVRPDHPLTSRVIVNRLWQFHFGHGLSHTSSDFGLFGDEPVHLELLDWLARELVRRDWSLKRLHRLVLTSAVYRQSGPSDQALRDDPENLFFSYFARRRLSGEELRDAMLHAGEVLDLRRGGESVLPPLPAELTQTLLKNQWNVSPRQADHYRRSIYVFARRNLRYPLFDVFDRPDANATCPERHRSTTATQSLHLLNSQLSLDAAQRLAGCVLSEADDRRGQVRRATVRTLGRLPTDAESARMMQFLEQDEKLLRTEGRRPVELATPIPLRDREDPVAGAAFVDLCLALFNLSEFVYVD